jgi:hypothetical protein
MTGVTHDLAQAVRSYARVLHAALGESHHVASPLGAWIVLALAASAAQEPEAGRLAGVLGMPLPDAARVARALLDDPHPAVAAAAAVWTAVAPTGPAADWVDGLPAPVERGRVPDQAGADAWARRRTSGMIDRFPIDMGRAWSCVLASALATRISWVHPFTAEDGIMLGRAATVLRTAPHGHQCAVARHPVAGDVAAHRAYAAGMTVTSVIAAPGVPTGLVLDAAHDAAAGVVDRRSLFDLPLGDGHAWTVTESDGIAGDEHAEAVLPAWSARSTHDLTRPELGFDAAAAALGRLFPAGNRDARQAAYARYHQHGFEAAADTELTVELGAHAMTPGRRRDALLRFDRPYAVVATATTAGGPWNGLPVFSAWVTEPDQSPAGSRTQP